MECVTPGHRYHVANFEDKTDRQIIQFIHKEPDSSDPTKLVTINDGTTNEELMEVLIDRIKFLNAKFPCRENSLAITDLESARNWMMQRTREREKRNVEGKHIA